MEYLVGYIYDGNIADLKPTKTLQEAEKYIFKLVGDENYTEDEWEHYFNGLSVKHYYIDYNQLFIIKLKKV